MTLKEARQITGGLSNPSKMPGKGYSLPAGACPTGAWLRQNQESVCFGCYACKGRYSFDNVQKAMFRRLDSLAHPDWEDAMVLLISSEKVPWFRWHDSGDLQSSEHLCRICRVCERTPKVSYRLPTKEHGLVFRHLLKSSLPDNLTIRLSAYRVGETVPYELADSPLAASMVFKEDDDVPEGAFVCPATTVRHECAECRYCWGRSNKCVAYKAH